MARLFLRSCTILIIPIFTLIQLSDSKKIYDCVYDKNKCSVFCGVPLNKMPAGFGCLNSLKACLCPTTPNTKKCRPINPADKDETNGCNSINNCPSKRLIPMICEFWDQNRMCACFRTEDGKPAPGPGQPEPEKLPQAIPNISGQPSPDSDQSVQATAPQDQSGQGTAPIDQSGQASPPQDQSGSGSQTGASGQPAVTTPVYQPAVNPVDQPAPTETGGEIPVADPSMNAVP